jgi:hypothetical protein
MTGRYVPEDTKVIKKYQHFCSCLQKAEDSLMIRGSNEPCEKTCQYTARHDSVSCSEAQYMAAAFSISIEAEQNAVVFLLLVEALKCLKFTPVLALNMWTMP